VRDGHGDEVMVQLARAMEDYAEASEAIVRRAFANADAGARVDQALGSA
jgi:hypothetical protein